MVGRDRELARVTGLLDATQAALAAVADAFGVRRDAVTVVTGKTSRTKVVEVTGGDPRILADLLGPD